MSGSLLKYHSNIYFHLHTSMISNIHSEHEETSLKISSIIYAFQKLSTRRRTTSQKTIQTRLFPSSRTHKKNIHKRTNVSPCVINLYNTGHKHNEGLSLKAKPFTLYDFEGQWKKALITTRLSNHKVHLPPPPLLFCSFLPPLVDEGKKA